MIEQGKLINQLELQVNSFMIRMLNTNDIPQVMILQNFVLGLMKNRSFCVPLSPEEHFQIMSGNGESIGLFIGDRLYAVCSILFPGHREDNMARQLDFADGELLRVAQLELSMVHPDLRGNDLQKRMAEILARRAKRNYRYLFTTVSPYNYPSIKTVTSMGLNIAKLCNMYDQWARYVVYKDYIKPLKLDKSSVIQVPNTSFEEQQRLLDKGYFGFSQSKDEEGIKIMFAKKLREQH